MPSLQEAAIKNDVGLIKSLIASGVDVNGRDGNYSGAALDYTITFGHLGAAVALIDAGADVNACHAVGTGTPLHIAAVHTKPQITNLLINSGADVNARNASGVTPAFYSLLYGGRTVLKNLLRAGAVPPTQSMPRVQGQCNREDALALLDSVNAAGGWDEFALRHRVILKSIVSKCRPLPDDCLLAIAAFVAPPGGF